MYCDAVYNRPAAERRIIVVGCIGETECGYLRNARDDQKLTAIAAHGEGSVTVPWRCWIVGCSPEVVASSGWSEGTRSGRLWSHTRTNLNT